MKFYSYSNNNGNYTRAVSLENVCSVCIDEDAGSSKIRYDVTLKYYSGRVESFIYLTKEEAEKVYKEIIDLLNGAN